MLQKNHAMIVLMRPEENMGGGNKINGRVNQVDEERYQRASIFLSINRLKVNVPVRLSHDALGIGHTYIPSLVLVCLVFSLC